MTAQTEARSAPAIDNADIAFMAVGASEAMSAMGHRDLNLLIDRFEGRIGIMQEVIRHADTLARIYAEQEDAFNGVWAYDVAQPFGQRYVEALALGFEANAEQLVRTLISEV